MVAGCGRHHLATAGAPAPIAVATPLPTAPPPWSAQELTDLHRRLESIFTSDVTRSSMGMAVVAGDGTELVTRRASVPVTPASTLKLVVAASALDALGPKHQFETRFAANAPPDADGTVHGDVWLVGGGDPSLRSDQLRDGVGALWRSGVRNIDGSLIIDDTAFSGPEQNPRWDPDDLTYDYAAGTSAISLDEDTVEFDVTPNPGGGAAKVRAVPENASITFDGTIASGGSSSSLTIERKPELPTFGADSADAPEPHNGYLVDGNIVQGETQKFLKPVLGMPGYVGGVVASMLAQRGIGLAGGFHVAAAPADAVTLWSHRSAPLADLVHEMLVNSNNHTAEQLLRIVGERSGHPGTDAAGIAFEKRQLAELRVPHDRMAVYDGSGLAPSDRILPVTLATLLAQQARTAYGDVYVRSLPRVGFEGTVKGHNLRDARGRARAKSGHIENVNALAGFVESRHHGRVAFAFVVNDPRADADVVYDEVDRALDALSTF